MAGLKPLHAVLCLLSVLLVALGWGLDLITPLERPVSDALLRLPTFRPGTDMRFAAVLIDDSAIDRVGPLPWPRETLAGLIDAVRDAGARAVVIDVLLAEPTTEEADAALEKALSEGPTILGASLDAGGGWILPLDRFGGPRVAAHVHAEVESDGMIRAIASSKQAGDLSLLALSAAASGLAGPPRAFRVGEPLRPDFRPAPKDIPAAGAIDVLAGESPRELLRDRVVFIGTTASGATDQFFVPVGRTGRPEPGVLVHASAAASISRGGLLGLAPAWFALVLAFAASVAPQILRTRAGRLHPLHVVTVLAIILVTAVLLLKFFGVILPTVGLLLAAATSAILREIVESRDAQRETGAILHALVRESDASTEAPPHSVRERLQLARQLQSRVIRDRDLRRTLLEGLAEGVALMDAEGRPLLSNRAVEFLWGYVPDWSEVVAATAPLSPYSDDALTAEVHRNGRALEVRLQSLPEDTFLVLVRDQTAQKDLEQRRREMQRLVSHELKTPLASISGFGDMLQRYSLSDEELKRTAGLIRSEADRLGAMVRTFLDLERIGEGLWDGEWETVDLAALVRDRCTVLAAAATEKSISITPTGDDRVPMRGIPTLLSQLMDNLIGNAVKHSPEGTEVTVDCRTTKNRAVLKVSDSGEGIPAEAMPHLFERFYRVPGTSAHGSGLGLALVRQVADNHGAQVRADSTVGEGATFTVVFDLENGHTA